MWMKRPSTPSYADLSNRRRINHVKFSGKKVVHCLVGVVLGIVGHRDALLVRWYADLRRQIVRFHDVDCLSHFWWDVPQNHDGRRNLTWHDIITTRDV
jgi:hypothetical protein